MELEDITKEMFVAWKADPVTAAFMKGVQNQRFNTMEGMANGAFEKDKLQQAIGFCVALNLVQNVSLEENQNDASNSVASDS